MFTIFCSLVLYVVNQYETQRYITRMDRNTHTAEGFLKYSVMPFSFIIRQWQRHNLQLLLFKCRNFFYFLIAFNEPHGPSAASNSNKQMQIYCTGVLLVWIVQRAATKTHLWFIFPVTLWKLHRSFSLRPPTSYYNMLTFELNLDFYYLYCSMSVYRTFKC